MAQEIKSAIARSRSTLLSDIGGVASLVVLLFASLSLPGLL